MRLGTRLCAGLALAACAAGCTSRTQFPGLEGRAAADSESAGADGNGADPGPSDPGGGDVAPSDAGGDDGDGAGGDGPSPGDESTVECVLNSGCAEVCILNSCAAQSPAQGACDEDADCLGGNLCVGVVCEPPGGVPIYRSVGPGQVTSLKSGSSIPMSISGDTATFATSLPDRIGVGDVLLYDFDGAVTPDSIAFVSGRESATRYTLQATDGGAPTATTGATTAWTIYRAYADLWDALHGVENPGITGPLADFDSWADGKDLVTAGQIWNIACYGDAPENGNVENIVVGFDWVTDASHYLRIYTPSEPSEVGISQRHVGVFDASRYHILRTAQLNDHIVSVWIPWVRIEGLQIVDDVADSDDRGIYVDALEGEVRLSGNLIRGNPTNLQNSSGISCAGTGTYDCLVWNNIVYDFTREGFFDNSVNGTGLVVYLYNNTFYGVDIGVTAVWAPVIAKNNIFAGLPVGGECIFDGGGLTTSSDFNVCNLTETLSGAGSQSGVTPFFKNAATRNLLLGAADSVAAGAGTSLATDPNLPFATDFSGQLRLGAWDIGADQRSPGPTYGPHQAALDTAVAAGTAGAPLVTTSAAEFGLSGQSNYVGGVLADNGNIIAIPSESDAVLIIDTNDLDSSYEVPATLPHPGAFAGGVLAWDGQKNYVYALPAVSGPAGELSFFKIDPDDGSTAEVGEGAIPGEPDTALFSPGATDLDGNIYAMPDRYFEVLKLDPRTNRTTFIATPYATVDSGARYSGAVLAPNGRIYAVPANGNPVMVIDPLANGGAGSATIPASLTAATGDYSSGVIGPDGKLYFVPSCDDNVGVLTLGVTDATDSFTTLTVTGLSGDFGCGKYFSAAMGGDGFIYGVPGNDWYGGTKPLLRVDAGGAAVALVGDYAEGSFFAWLGAVGGPNGLLYGIPNQNTRVLVIDTRANQPLPASTLRAPYFNKW